jgi:hypothetical protein
VFVHRYALNYINPSGRLRVTIYFFITVPVSMFRNSFSLSKFINLEGPGSNLVGDESLRQFRPALGPIQPPVKWVPGLSWDKVRPGRAADHSPSSSAAVMEQ